MSLGSGLFQICNSNNDLQTFRRLVLKRNNSPQRQCSELAPFTPKNTILCSLPSWTDKRILGDNVPHCPTPQCQSLAAIRSLSQWIQNFSPRVPPFARYSACRPRSPAMTARYHARANLGCLVQGCVFCHWRVMGQHPCPKKLSPHRLDSTGDPESSPGGPQQVLGGSRGFWEATKKSGRVHHSQSKSDPQPASSLVRPPTLPSPPINVTLITFYSRPKWTVINFCHSAVQKWPKKNGQNGSNLGWLGKFGSKN